MPTSSWAWGGFPKGMSTRTWTWHPTRKFSPDKALAHFRLPLAGCLGGRPRSGRPQKLRCDPGHGIPIMGVWHALATVLPILPNLNMSGV